MVSALLGAGQLDARRYPLARLQLEYLLLRQRDDIELHNLAVAVNTAMQATQPTKGNQGFNNFKKFLSRLIP